MPDSFRNDTIRLILSALSMSRSISVFIGTLLCPPVKRLLVRKPVNGLIGSLLVALSLASSCFDTTAESICFPSATISCLSSLSSSRKSISLFTKSARSSFVRFSSASLFCIILCTCSASIEGDSASSMTSCLHTKPSLSACNISCCNSFVMIFSYEPSCSFMILLLYYQMSTKYLRHLFHIRFISLT